MYPIISHGPNLLRKNVWAVIFFQPTVLRGNALEKPQFLPGVTPTIKPPRPDSTHFHLLGVSPADLGLDSGHRKTCPTSPFGKYNFCSFLLRKNSLLGGRTRKNGFEAESHPWGTVKTAPSGYWALVPTSAHPSPAGKPSSHLGLAFI